MRTKIVAGNWKMNKSLEEGLLLVEQIVADFQSKPNCGLVICPPYIHLSLVADQCADAEGISVGAQNCHHENAGAFTGEIAPSMLAEMGVQHVILGHSERREYNHENAQQLTAKLEAAMQEGLTPIFCCGESQSMREEGDYLEFVVQQLRDSLFHLDAAAFGKIVIAYEPIWAIGTGLTASAEQAQEMHAYIRNAIAGQYGDIVANNTSILYGGSCKPGNAQEIFGQPDVDGGLIGGASLKADDFLAIYAAL